MNVGELKKILANVDDHLGITVYDPGDPSVGIFDCTYTIMNAGVDIDYDDEGKPLVISFQIIVGV